jgi:hypothetical protein
MVMHSETGFTLKYEASGSRHTFGKSTSFYKVKLAVRLKFKEFATVGFKRGIQL